LSCGEFWRSFQYLWTMPPKPPKLPTSDHMNFASENDVIASTTFSDSLLTDASVASGEASKNRKMWLWSSIGASSRLLPE